MEISAFGFSEIKMCFFSLQNVRLNAGHWGENYSIDFHKIQKKTYQLSHFRCTQTRQHAMIGRWSVRRRPNTGGGARPRAEQTLGGSCFDFNLYYYTGNLSYHSS